MSQDRLRDLVSVGVVAVIRAPDRESAVRGAVALAHGGVRGIEITFTTPDAPEVITRLDRELGELVHLGAGTVTTPTQADAAADAGARFLVSPGATPRLAAAMTATGLPCLMGAWTPGEVLTVLELGTDAVKLFPASTGGTAHLKALRGPFPDVAFVPTGGVSPDNLGEWHRAGAVAVGAGSDLCSTEDLARGRWATLTRRAEEFSRGWAEATSR